MTQRAIDGDYIYFVTANVQDRRWFFVEPEKAENLGQAVQTSCRMKKFELLAYCILPNHFHLLVRKLSAEEISKGSTSDQAQRTLESVRCRTEGALKEKSFLFPHRRLSSRRSRQAVVTFTLGELMQSIKGSFSQTLLKGKFWQHRSNFRIIGDQEYLNNVLEYIQHNYLKMNLPDWYGQLPFVFLDMEKIANLVG